MCGYACVCVCVCVCVCMCAYVCVCLCCCDSVFWECEITLIHQKVNLLQPFLLIFTRGVSNCVWDYYITQQYTI